jgi:hypothetical protein
VEATNYYVTPNYVASPPNPQIAVGPDDIFTVVNRNIARYPNPNASGNTGAGNPYAYPPTHAALIDAWLGISGGTGNTAGLCPSNAGGGTCLIDNISIRYDQLQGRFVFLATVTDLEMHMSNWVLVISKWADFACSTSGLPNNPAVCAGSSDLFTLPIVDTQLNGSPGFAEGGPNVGGINGNWIGYVIPINVNLGPTGGPGGGLPTGDITAGAPFCVNGGNPGTAPANGGNGGWNNGPGNTSGTQTTGCTNYYPTAARMGFDNDNIILISPVLDQTQAVFAPSGGQGLPGGAFAGTRVVTIPKLVVYNGTALALSQGPFVYPSATVLGLGAVNLADDIFTGTLTGCSNTSFPSNQYAAAIPALCIGPTGSINPIPGITPQTGPSSPASPGFFGYNAGVSGPTSNIPTIIWEPDNLRGRALASFDAQVGISPPTGPEATSVEGVITPLDYLVGILVPGTPGGIQINSFRQNFWVQPIVFSCPATFIFGSNSGVTFCGTQGGNGGQVADLAQLGVLSTWTPATAPTTQSPRTSANPMTIWGDPQLVGQGPATSAVSGDPAPTGPSGFPGLDVVGGGSSAQLRMFVGDARPQQVIFREGLLYIARTVMPMDTDANVLATSTVVYDILKQSGPACQTNGALGLGGPGPFCTVAPTGVCPVSTGVGCQVSPYSANGVTIPNPVTVLETQWYNGTTPDVCPPIGGVSGPVGTGNTPNNTSEPLCDGSGFGFYTPMYEVPANVIGGLATSGNAPISPISLFPWLEKLFVGMTTGGTSNLAGTFATNNPSLWDFRPGDDAYDSPGLLYIDPINGRHKTTTNDPFLCNIVHNPVLDPGTAFNSTTPSAVAPTATCPVVPFGFRGGASTDPNDGSLWLYGPFAKKRFSQVGTGPGAWGTSVANYALDFPTADAYNNDNSYFVDVQPGTNQFFTWIQISKNVGIGFQKLVNGTCPTGGTSGNPNPPNPPIIPPGTGNNAGNTTTGAPQICNVFGPTDLVSRSEMAKWVVLAQMDPAQVTNYLAVTGGIPGCKDIKGNTTSYPGQTLGCVNNTAGVSTASSFADGPCSGFSGAAACPANSVPIPTLASTIGSSYSYPGIFDDPNLPYIEVLKRRGYTKGCQNTGDVTLTFCPTQAVTRGQMAVFVIRAKMNNVFPTSLSGVPLQAPYGDNFTLFLGQNPQAVPGAFSAGVYFADVPTTNQFFIYIQKMRELRITNGTMPNADPNNPCAGPCYSPNLSITRQEVATFIVRAFFL